MIPGWSPTKVVQMVLIGCISRSWGQKIGFGGRLSLVVLVSEKPNLVSEKSGKSQGILFINGAGNPVK